MTISELPGLICKALILWDARIRLGYRGDDVRDLRNQFATHVYRDFPREAATISRTNLDLGFDWLLNKEKTVTGWYCVLLGETEFNPVICEDGHVRINPNLIDRWESLCGCFDPDTLLALSLARQKQRIDKIADWKTVARAEDECLKDFWRRGLSDLHVHVSGVRLPHAAWHDILHDRAPMQVFRVLNTIYREAGRNLADDFDEVRVLKAALERKFSLPPPRSGRASLPQNWWQWSAQLLAPERELLARSWSACLDAKEADQDTLRVFDRYLWHKHCFFRLVRQSSMPTEPGLRHFELHYFSALKRKNPREGWRNAPSPAYASSPRSMMQTYGDACQYLLESDHLQRIELRISPFERASDYPKFFKLWERLKGQIDCQLKHRGRPSHEIPKVRFAVHFRRSLARQADPRNKCERDPDELLKLRGLDRATAALGLALRNDEPDGFRMRALARIDVAGQERDTATSVFVLHLRLLRGDKQALKYLNEIPAKDPRRAWLGQWLRLWDRRQQPPREGLE